jgi:hypothetical protein
VALTLGADEFPRTGHPADTTSPCPGRPLELHGRVIPDGLAQALVIYPGPGALGIVSGICLHPDDLDPAAVPVAGITARMTITRAALPPRMNLTT